MCCKCRTMSMEQEKSVMIHGFIIFSVLQCVLIVTLCSISMYYLSSANVTFFLQVDIVTLMMGIIFLSLIIVILAWSSAINNTSCLWSVFHCFMIVLLLIEMVVCMLTSNISQFLNSAKNEWVKSDNKEKLELEVDLGCCGFQNSTDSPGEPCPPEGLNVGCAVKIEKLMTLIRNTASVAMFVCFVFGMFIDFAGCAICFHPDTITFQEHEREEALLIPSYTTSQISY